MRLTDLTIRSLPKPESGAVIHLDDAFKGFGVRVSQGGAKSFVLTYGKARKRITLGRYGIITLSQARALAIKHLADRTLGITDAPPEALESLVTRFLTEKRSTLRPGTMKTITSVSRHLMLKVYVRDVTPQMLQDLFSTLNHLPS